MSFSEVIDCTKFLYTKLFFCFDKKFYKQKFGSSIGLSTLPPFADIVMEDLQSHAINVLKNKHNCIPLFYIRYVDDILICLEKSKLDIFMTIFNGCKDF